jgi:molecular chaperone HtpG
VIDNGVGMGRSEVVENLGTIARSGTLEFLKQQEGTGGDASPDLIGQFGVGFYSSFMVADEVEVITRKVGEEGATRWVSKGDGSYTLEDAERADAGTTISLHLKAVDGDAGVSDYVDEWVLRQIVKKYSDFVGYPVTLEIEGKELSGPNEPLNSMKAIWTRNPDDVTEDEHKEFYKHVSHDWQDPLLHVATAIEGTFEARALLYVPSVAPFDLYHREMAHRGIQLYVKRVFIMDECRELMPEWLRFVKGVVDAEDLSLNVSREMLQQDRQIHVIRKHLVKRTLESLAELAKDDTDKYMGFWTQFGPVLKEGLLGLSEAKDKERILDLMRVASTHDDSALTSLGDALERMPDDQEVIYYLVGQSREVLTNSPHLEAFREKGIEVLLFTDHVDEVWLEQMPPEYHGKTWQSVGRGEVDLEGKKDGDAEKAASEDREQDESSFRDLIACLRASVQDHVKEVRLSQRLKTSAACLVLEEGDMSPRVAEMMRQAGQDAPEVKPILELNAKHPLLPKLQDLFAKDASDPILGEYAELLFDQAVLAEGGSLDDPGAFSRKLADLMARAL